MRMNKAIKVDKEEVMYRHSTDEELDKGYVCGKCLYFDNGQCELVKGSIDPEDWCRLFVTELAKDEVHLQLGVPPFTSKRMKKDDSGGIGYGNETGATVWTSENTGAFTRTYGDKGRKKKKGVDRLVDFVTENSPEQKMFKETNATAGHGFMGPLENEPSWKKRRRETDTPNPVEPKDPTLGEEKDQSVVDQNSFTNRLANNVKEEKNKRRARGAAADARDDASDTGSAVGQLALAWGFGDDELRRSGKKDKLPPDANITKKK